MVLHVEKFGDWLAKKNLVHFFFFLQSLKKMFSNKFSFDYYLERPLVLGLTIILQIMILCIYYY